MPIYLSAERKASAVLNTAVGGEIIETAPYFTGLGYSNVGFLINSTTSEHVSKFVEVSAGYSLEPIGKITYQKSTYSNTKQTKLNNETSTTGLNNLFPNLVVSLGELNTGSGFTTSWDLYWIGYSKLFSKSFISTNFYLASGNTPSIAWVCSPNFSSITQIYNVNTNSLIPYQQLLNAIIESSTICLLGATNTTTYLTSSNGTTFTQRTAPVTISNLASNLNTFLIHSTSGVIYTSAGSDGVSWTNRGNIGIIANAATTVAFGNNLFVALTSTSVIKTSSDNGVNWITKTLPETNNWLAVFFNSTLNLFILVPNGKNYFYVTLDFNVFINKSLPFTTSSGMYNLVGMVGEQTHINNYLSRDLTFWNKPNYVLCLRALICPPTYQLSTGYNSGGTLRFGKYEIMSNSFFSPARNGGLSYIDAFVRTALD